MRNYLNLHLAAIIAIILPFFYFASADAQQSVTPGYQICNNSSGSTQCGWQPISTTNPLPVTTSTSGSALPVVSSSDYPNGATPVAASSGNVAATTATATLAAAVGKTTYLTAFTITGGGATAGSMITCTIGTLAGGTTWSINVSVPTGATAGITPVTMALTKPIPANGTNITISIVCPSFGAGNTNAAVTASGYQQ